MYAYLPWVPPLAWITVCMDIHCRRANVCIFTVCAALGLDQRIIITVSECMHIYNGGRPWPGSRYAWILTVAARMYAYDIYGG